AEADVNPRAVRDRLAGIDHAVAILVAQPPDIGREGEDELVVVGEDPMRHVGDHVVESVEDLVGAVSYAVPVTVLDAVDALRMYGQISPVARAVAVEVLQPLILITPGGVQLAQIELTLVLDRLEGERL